jgi:DNA repair photolyase
MPTHYREEPCKSALNRVQGMPFQWSLNPYMGCAHQCTFCYVRAFERRADRPSDSRYGASIRVKTNVAQVLRAEVTRRSWKREHVAIGAATDPYQPAEGKYQLTRQCLQVFCSVHNPFSIVTRGPMIVRDIDILAEASRRASVEVSFSVPTLDHDIWRLTEPGTAPPHQRLRALRILREAGVRTGVGMAPLLPGLSDRPDRMRDVVIAAKDAGASYIWANVLYLKPGTREHFLENLARDWPAMLGRYQHLYRLPYVDKANAEPILDRFRLIRGEYDFTDERHCAEDTPKPGQMPLFEFAKIGS